MICNEDIEYRCWNEMFSILSFYYNRHKNITLRNGVLLIYVTNKTINVVVKLLKKINLAKKMQNIIKILSIFAKFMRKNNLLIYPTTNLNKFTLKKQRLMFLNIFVKNTTLFKMSKRKKLKRRNIKN